MRAVPATESGAGRRRTATVLIGVLSLGVLATSVAVAAGHKDSDPGSTGAQVLADGAGVGNQLASRAPVPTVKVAKLGRLYLPDAIVGLPAGTTSTQLQRLANVQGIQGLVVVKRGVTTLEGRRVKVMAVDPGSFRAFTPRPTAASDPLWQVPARGEAIASYALSKKAKLPLGGTVSAGPTKLRIGAFAEFSLPGVDLVVGESSAAATGADAFALLVSAPSAKADALRSEFVKALGVKTTVTLVRPAFVSVTTTAAPAATGTSQPKDLRTLYMNAATTCPGLPWGVLAAIGQVETGHGRNTNVSSAGAMGPMQFLPTTWAVYGVDGDGDGRADILDQADSVYSAARYLCASGGGQSTTLRSAIYAYNHSDSYVNTVLSLALQYR